MVNKFSIPRGTADILPGQTLIWQQIEEKARKLLNIYNYKEIRTPVFEETSLFKRSLGQTSDVVNKQLLELVSSKEEGYALRPEGTASIARSYIENSFDKKEFISKLYYIGPMFRGERPQKGRLRQFNQIGAEVIGADTSNAYIDAEVISLCVNLLKAFGMNDFSLSLNTLGTAQDKEKFSVSLREQFKKCLNDLCEDCQSRFDRNVFRVLDCKNRKCIELVKSRKIDYSYLSKESLDYYSQVKDALNMLNISFKEERNLVRGLDYYTHTVFEISSGKLGSQDALGAGGRYNNLVEQLGGPKVDAIGFALGIERILLALNNEVINKQEGLKVFVIALEDKLFSKAFEILNILRSNGISSDISFKASSMKSQMRYADKSNSSYVMIIGQDEINKGVVTLKNMQSGEQKEINIAEISNLKDL